MLHICIIRKEWQLAIRAVGSSGVKGNTKDAADDIKLLTVILMLKALSQVFNFLRRQKRTKTKVLLTNPAITKKVTMGRILVISPFHSYVYPGVSVVFMFKLQSPMPEREVLNILCVWFYQLLQLKCLSFAKQIHYVTSMDGYHVYIVN